MIKKTIAICQMKLLIKASCTAIFTRLLCSVLLVCLGLFSQAQQSKQYQFRHIDINKGLSHNQVTCLLKDGKGFMWFGTISGLNRYDGQKFKIFKHDVNDSTSIDDDYIFRLKLLPDNHFLVETRNQLNIYDPVTEQFNHRVKEYFDKMGLPDTSLLNAIQTSQNDFYFLFANYGLYKYNTVSRRSVRVNTEVAAHVTSITQSTSGGLWVMYRDGMLEKLDTKTNRVTYRSMAIANRQNKQLFTYMILADRDDDIWLYTKGSPNGILHFNPLTGEVEKMNKEEGTPRLNTNIVMSTLEDNQNQIWVCTDHGGINIIDKKKHTVQYVVNNTDDNASISQNSISAAYKDDQGIIWIGTYKKGINSYHESIIKFPLYRHQPGNIGSLQFDDINRFAEDAKGNIWIGTNGGGLIYFDRTSGKFTNYLHQPGNDNSLCSNIIVSLCIDKKGRLWIGSYYGGLDCYDGTRFTHYKHDPANNASISDDRIWEIFEDPDSTLWVGTLAGGLNRMDKMSGVFYHYSSGQPNSVRSNYISAISQDKDGDLWIGTDKGCDVLEKRTNRFLHFTCNNDRKTGLLNCNVMSLFVDSKNRQWVGTSGGLSLFNKATQQFQHFTVSEGLPDNAILNILEDNKHTLWVSTLNGIANFSVIDSANGRVAVNCVNYDEADGLQGIEFNENAALKTSKGELLFGGPAGFNLFYPQNIITQKQVPQVVFTDFQLFNKSIAPGEKINGEVLLQKAINEIQTIRLNYDQNVIAIEFAAINYFNSEKTRYAYKLEGLKDEWLISDAKMRKAIFTNLSPGEYTFRVRLMAEDGSWKEAENQLRIVISPPFWKSPLAYFLYFLAVVAALYVGRIRIIRKARQRFALEQEREQAQRMHELDLMKIRFFTNVSHEFRTPLSLIISPVEKLLKESKTTGEKKHIQLILRNARRLLNMVNQLLDFRKLEEHELRLNKTSGDIIRFIRDISYSFSDIAENKQITFSFITPETHFFTTYDADKLERILFNLLSNAFKFTPVGGTIKVLVELAGAAGERMIQIKVSDTGIGISKDKYEKIFERFFQNEVPSIMVNQGSGIGLAITKEFVRLHGGTITVESEVNQGSCFTILLPAAPVQMETVEILKPEYTVEADTQEAEVEQEPAIEPKLENKTEEKAKPGGKKKTILLIEDNHDFRFYIKDNLSPYYNIVEAADGKTGWQKALSDHPNLIICDVSMPEMNGIDLSRKIKGDTRTSFIPIILLTALTGEVNQLEGLKTGASDYVTKPFNFEILHSKIKNLLLQQDNFKKTYQKQVQVHTTVEETESADEKFIQQALAVIEKNIANPDFTVEEMSKDMFMSRGALYNKIFSLTGKSPIEFIRFIRLQRAAQLLQKGGITVAEVAYQVGFNNPKYFSRYFKMEYDMLPSVYTGASKNNSGDGS